MRPLKHTMVLLAPFACGLVVGTLVGGFLPDVTVPLWVIAAGITVVTVNVALWPVTMRTLGAPRTYDAYRIGSLDVQGETTLDEVAAIAEERIHEWERRVNEWEQRQGDADD